MASTSLPQEAGRSTALDRYFSLPAIRHVSATRPLEWLRRGWRDLGRNTWLSALYGLVFAFAGAEILLLAEPRPYLFTAAVSGFMLIAPMLVAGLYETSRRRSEGLTTRFIDSLAGWTRNGDAMALYGLVLALIGIAWERLSAILFALSYGGEITTVHSFLSTVFLSGDYIAVTVTYIAAGAVVAALVFAISVISVPMLVDRDIDVPSAIAASLKAVRRNPAAMAVWAVMLVALITIGFATLLVGMIVVVPLAAHASWHAYRDLAQSE
jgi:uncharacterized membrane protein